MIRLDSNKFEASIETIDHRPENVEWSVNQISKGGIILKDTESINNPSLGFKNITIDHRRNLVHIETSAKILKDQYKEGITINTIERVVNEINKTGIITINPTKFIDTASILRCDFTDNVFLPYDVNDISDSLLTLKANHRYNVNQYKQAGNRGIVFAGRQTSFKERMIVYHKLPELLKDKQIPRNSDLHHKIVNDFANVWRVEQNTTSHRMIRKRANTTTNRLYDVLSSDARPNLVLLNKIQDNVPTIDLFTDYDQIRSFRDFRTRVGDEEIIKRCNYDIATIEALLRARFASRDKIYQWKKHYQNLIREMLTKKGGQGIINQILTDITNQLAA